MLKLPTVPTLPAASGERFAPFGKQKIEEELKNLPKLVSSINYSSSYFDLLSLISAFLLLAAIIEPAVFISELIVIEQY